jgi:hypothetical protein
MGQVQLPTEYGWPLGHMYLQANTTPHHTTRRLSGRSIPQIPLYNIREGASRPPEIRPCCLCPARLGAAHSKPPPTPVSMTTAR